MRSGPVAAARRRGWLPGVLVVVAVLAALVAGRTPAAGATRYLDASFEVDVQRDLVYGSATDLAGNPVTLTLDLYTPRGDLATGRPVFVFAHGGFFVTGDKSGATAWARRMAARGWVAASINYRLGPEAVLAPVDTELSRLVVDNARADMQTSVRWFRANAAALGIDPYRIAVGGTSAGAVTALGVAVGSDDVPPGDHAEFSSAVCTAVSISGANDPLAVSAGDAGAIFHHGSADTVVPFDQAVATRDAMVGSGLAVAWHEYPGEGHDLSSPALAAIVEPTIAWLYERVAVAPHPCSPAMAVEPRVPAGRQTPVSGSADRSGVVSLVAVDNVAPGFVQVLGCGAAPGGSSNLNSDAPGQIRAALAVVRFDGAGRACIFNQVGTHLVADLQGWFAPGAFDDVPDVRLLDTRTTTRPGDGDQTVIIGRPDSTGVVSLVVTETAGAGYVQVLPCGTAPGGWSNLNADAAGQTRAGLAFVRFGADGRACVFTQTSAHLVVDLQGYMADASFDDVADVRVLDTRTGPRPAAGSSTRVTGRPGSTAVLSIVATETVGAGFVQALPCGAAPGGSSNLNTDRAGQTVAGLAFVRFDAGGEACLFTQASAHLVVDVQGYLAGEAFDDVTDVRLLDTRTWPPAS